MMVECKLCKAQFPGEGDQGHGCAATVYQNKEDLHWYVVGHYGSRLYDMFLYKIMAPKHEQDEGWLPIPTETTSPVCDVCISVWDRLKRLELVKEDVL
jgi:hypothetical protein